MKRKQIFFLQAQPALTILAKGAFQGTRPKLCVWVYYLDSDVYYVLYGCLMPYLKPWINQILFSLSKQSGGGKPSEHKSQSGRNCAEICLKCHKKEELYNALCNESAHSFWSLTPPLCPSSLHCSSDLGSLSDL